MEPLFVLLGAPASWAEPVAQGLERPLGFRPRVIAADEIPKREGETFVLPCAFELSLFDREALAETLSARRRAGSEAHFFHDDVDLGSALVAQAFAERAHEALAKAGLPRERAGVLVAGEGAGDPSSRAQLYRLMRLVWEQLGLARGEVGFLRHPTPFVRAELERWADEPLAWVVLPAMAEPGERYEHLRVIVEDHLREHPDAAATLAEPAGDHPALIAWVQQRALALWRRRRQGDGGRVRSVKRASLGAQRRVGDARTGVAADCRNATELRALLPEAVLDAETVFAKVTWHGYATGTYTDAVALDALLEAVPGKVVLLEGHTSSRNAAGAVDWDWETEARQHRAWIRAQEAEFLEKTGLRDVIARHGATYLNVTEAFWDEGGQDPEAFLPALVRERAGAPLMSYARFKGPTRLSLSNLFGLLPDPLRSRWHGPNITYFARVCCDVARRWGETLELYGVVEGLNYAVKWDRRGLYRSRWGNYDLIPAPGLATLSRGVAGADALAARLQGQDPGRSAFFDVVREELGIPAEAEALELPEEWVRRLA